MGGPTKAFIVLTFLIEISSQIYNYVKKLYSIILFLFLIGCDSEVPVYTSSNNLFNGHWVINATGDLEGAANV